ncbi:MAG: hypothetical protein R6V02_08115 [Candidatus Aminicenantes bacterium]
MTTIRLILCLAFMAGLSAGAVFSMDQPFRVTLEEVLSIGGLNDGDLFMWVDIEADAGGGVYVTDTMDYSVKYFSPEGKLLKKSGRKGQGPGEFLAPRSLEITGDYVYVIDQYRLGIHVFDKDLEFERIIPYRTPIAEFKVLSDNEIAVVPFSMEAEGTLEFIDSGGRKTGGMTYWGAGRGMLTDTVSFDVDPRGYFYLAYNFQDRIEKYDFQGNRLWSVSLLGIKKSKTKEVKDYVVPAEIIYKSLGLDRNGRLYVLGGAFSQNPSRDVYVLSAAGELMHTLTLPEDSHCIYIDRRNHLYARADSGVTIKKYRMVFH